MGENNFEFWLTGSFAVLIAGYYTFSSLTGGLQRTFLVLYGIISLVFFIRWIDTAYLLYSYSMDLLEQELNLFPFTLGTQIAFLLQTGLMIFGTIAAISFLRIRGRENSAED